jgi:hypothetical protein
MSNSWTRRAARCLVAAAAALVLGTGAGYGNQPSAASGAGPTTVPWPSKFAGAFVNDASASVHGGWLGVTGTQPTGGSIAILIPVSGNGPFTLLIPVVVDASNPGAFAGLQLLFNASNANNADVEVDMFTNAAGAGGGDTHVWAGQFGQPNSGETTFSGTNCVTLRAEQDAGGNLTLSASADGMVWTPLHSKPAPAPSPRAGTVDRAISFAAHQTPDSAVILAGPPQVTGGARQSYSTIATAISGGIDVEEEVRSLIRRGDTAMANTRFDDAATLVNAAIEGIDTLTGLEKASEPAKTAKKQLQCALKADAKAKKLLGKGKRADATNLLNDGIQCKRDALDALRRLQPLLQ